MPSDKTPYITKIFENSWEAQGLHVLNSLSDLKDDIKELRPDVAEIKNMLIELRGEFKRYNNFNERLRYQEELRKEDGIRINDRLIKVEEVLPQVTTVTTKVSWILGGIVMAVTLLFNVGADIVKGWLTNG